MFFIFYVNPEPSIYEILSEVKKKSYVILSEAKEKSNVILSEAKEESSVILSEAKELLKSITKAQTDPSLRSGWQKKSRMTKRNPGRCFTTFNMTILCFASFEAMFPTRHIMLFLLILLFYFALLNNTSLA